MFTTLISADELNRLIEDDAVSIVDCRFDLGDVAAGRREFEQQHIVGAVYADLDTDLSGPPASDHGRHPLPAAERMVEVFAALGIANDRQVVAYDASAGMIAARLWWMLRYMSHEAVAVLDGGWAAWQAADLPTSSGPEDPQAGEFQGEPREDRLVTLAQISPSLDLIDARAPERYRGETEPLDPRPGHIPGAKNHFFGRNLDEAGFFASRVALQQAFVETLGTLPNSDSVHYCGSGVSACHNVLAQVHAGYAEPRMYCGSWSEWCADPERPAALGELE